MNDVPLGLWIRFWAVILGMLAIDLGVAQRRAHQVTLREAALWSAIWIGLGLGFGGVVFWFQGAEAGAAYLAGYLIEKSLSIDNIFVFLPIFSTFAVSPALQP
jgi:tellurite resistance protein TerC